VPEIEGPSRRLLDFWHAKVVHGGILPKSVQADIVSGHYPLMEGGDGDRELIALGRARHRAIAWDQGIEE
jgi:hypothetical protein